MNSPGGGAPERIVTIMALARNEILCADENGESYAVEYSLLKAAGIRAPALGQRLIMVFQNASSRDVLRVHFPS
jgi:hypothetical protein